jgi:hypothetical protein
MKWVKMVLFGLALLAGPLISPLSSACQETVSSDPGEPSKLLVVWTSGDKDVAKNMVFMYTFNAKKNTWWESVHLLVWGASTKLLSEDKELQEYIKKMNEAGVGLFACKACADIYGVSEQLKSLGIDVKYTGVLLTQHLKSEDWVTITF